MTGLLVTLCLLLTALAVGPVMGYLAWLRGGHTPPDASPHGPAGGWPRVDVILPVHNEARWLEDKLRGLAALRYPRAHVRFWIADGASSDGTTAIAAAWVRRHARFRLLTLAAADKVAQLNAALGRSDADWLLVTDADAHLPPDTLLTLVRCATSAPDVAVVGAAVEPAHAHAFERLHWRISNRLRLRESARGAASIVTGPCYLFARDLLARLPGDVVADDVHVALAAAAGGRRVAFVDAHVVEQRAPHTLAELFAHKRRKADAYLREVFRFLPLVGRMPRAARAVFLWRAAQLLLVPVLSVAAILGTAELVWQAELPLAAATALALVCAPLGALLWLGRRGPADLALGMALAALLVAVLLTALAGYPFSRQTACYPKLTTRLHHPTEEQP